MLKAETGIELLQKIKGENLYLNLIQQLNKDFQLSNIDISFSEQIEPKDLQHRFNSFLLDLMQNNYDNYLNLVYRIDVSEKELLQIKSENLSQIVEQVGFIILKRECQKVWLKQNF